MWFLETQSTYTTHGQHWEVRVLCTSENAGPWGAVFLAVTCRQHYWLAHKSETAWGNQNRPLLSQSFVCDCSAESRVVIPQICLHLCSL